MSLSSTPGSFCLSDFIAELNDCYTDTERAFLSDYFGIRRPDHLKDLDIYETVCKGVYVHRGEFPLNTIFLMR